MIKNHGRLEEQGAGINISPMIDMVFILLIFFIVTTVFVEESGFGANKPDIDKTPTREEAKPMNIYLDQNNRIFIESTEIDIHAVRAKVSLGLVENADLPITIYSDKATNAGFMIHVMDEARLGGAGILALTLNQDS